MLKIRRKGITLISLVITVIVLLILATVAISIAVDSNGLFKKTGDAANSWNSSVADEGTAINGLINQLDELTRPKTLGDVYQEMIGKKVTYEANGQSEWIVLGEDTEKPGNILITTKTAVADGFTLNGTAAAWLSYVEDLHTACSGYGGTIQGIDVESRSITMEDINKVTGFTKPTFETYTFGTTPNFANKAVNYLYPKEGSTWTDADSKVWTSWKQPSAENEMTFDCDAYAYADVGYIYVQGGTTQTVETTEHIDASKGDIIWGTENELSYVVASRSVGVNPSLAEFIVACVDGGDAGADVYALCISFADDCYEYGSVGLVPVRPVVSLPSSIQVTVVNGEYDLATTVE